MSTRVKRFLWVLLIAGLLLAVGATVAYYRAPEWLCVDTGPVTASAIVVLGGEPIGRPARAAELFKAGAAPLVIVSGTGDCEEVERRLRAHGVPAEAIVRECDSRSTKENAELSIRLLRARAITNAIVVTSWYHSRRAWRCFAHAAPDLRFYSRPAYYGWRRAEWSRTGISAHIRLEYLKIAYYWIVFGIAPF